LVQTSPLEFQLSIIVVGLGLALEMPHKLARPGEGISSGPFRKPTGASLQGEMYNTRDIASKRYLNWTLTNAPPPSIPPKLRFTRTYSCGAQCHAAQLLISSHGLFEFFSRASDAFHLVRKLRTFPYVIDEADRMRHVSNISYSLQEVSIQVIGTVSHYQQHTSAYHSEYIIARECLTIHVRLRDLSEPEPYQEIDIFSNANITITFTLEY
jgi:hypothetical protein